MDKLPAKNRIDYTADKSYIDNVGDKSRIGDITKNPYIADNFEIWRGDKSIYDVIERDNLHFVITYAISKQGKTYFFRSILDYYVKRNDTVVIYIKETLEPEDINVYRLHKNGRILLTKFGEPIINTIEALFADKERNVKRYFDGRAKLDKTRIVLFFDDIQSIDVEMMRRFNKLANRIAKEGRHYNVVAFLGLQSYKTLFKNVRSQASLFLTFWPPDVEYRETVYKEFFRVGKYSQFISMRLPRYTIIGVEKSSDKKFIVLR